MNRNLFFTWFIFNWFGNNECNSSGKYKTTSNEKAHRDNATSKLFISWTLIGKSTSDLIIERVLLEAKRLLIHSENNFAEIALLLGYEDYSYFSRLFKNKCGESPSNFRKRYIQ